MNAIQQMVAVVKHVQTILDRTNVHVELVTFSVVTNIHVTVIDGCSYSFVRRGLGQFFPSITRNLTLNAEPNFLCKPYGYLCKLSQSMMALGIDAVPHHWR